MPIARPQPSPELKKHRSSHKAQYSQEAELCSHVLSHAHSPNFILACQSQGMELCTNHHKPSNIFPELSSTTPGRPQLCKEHRELQHLLFWHIRANTSKEGDFTCDVRVVHHVAAEHIATKLEEVVASQNSTKLEISRQERLNTFKTGA